jgi:hypothetical protein
MLEGPIVFQTNRGAIIVKRKQAFVDWINAKSEDGDAQLSLAAINIEPEIYLIPPFVGPEELKEILPQALEHIWQAELSGWVGEESVWPKDRSEKAFYKWFSIESSGGIYDLLEDELEREEV